MRHGQEQEQRRDGRWRIGYDGMTSAKMPTTDAGEGDLMPSWPVSPRSGFMDPE